MGHPENEVCEPAEPHEARPFGTAFTTGACGSLRRFASHRNKGRLEYTDTGPRGMPGAPSWGPGSSGPMSTSFNGNRMPHFVIECSVSILTAARADDVMQAVYRAAESTGLFAKSGVGGIKVRINPYTHLLNADGRRRFVHVFGSLMEGRTIEQKKGLSRRVVGALQDLLPDVEIISISIHDFERATYFNASMIGAEDGDDPGG